ncbi:MAG: AAA domain-containing protein [Gemmatimonadota bacterium]
MTNPAIIESLREVVDGCLEAVDVEARAVRDRLVRRGLDRPVPATGGHLQEWAGSGFLYEWELPAGRYDIRTDDAVRVKCDAGEGLAFVTAFERDRPAVRLTTSEWLGRHPGHAELAFDPTWLLDALADRLAEIGREPDLFHPETALRLFGRLFPGTGEEEPRRPESDELNDSQRTALRRMLGSDVQFVWGPPGTGKTRLLGHAAAELAERGRVLVVATTNAAVDEAAERVANSLGPTGVTANRIVRLGAEFSVTGDLRLSLEAALDRFASGPGGWLEDAITDLERELLGGRPRRAAGGAARRTTGRGARRSGVELHGAGPELDGAGSRLHGAGPEPRSTPPGGLRARLGRLLAAARGAEDPSLPPRLGRLVGEMQSAARLVLGEADVVVSTFARLSVREELAGLRFDSVIVDEASTAPLPCVLVAAARASRRAIAIGDFQQLPAVVVSRDGRAARWLARDAFREAGIVPDRPAGEPALPSERDRLCAMLVEQYRMAPPIRALVSDVFYGGRLRDAAEVARRPLAAAPLVLVDTTTLRPSVVRAEGSRSNPKHLEVLLRLLEILARRGLSDVAVVAPYRVHIRRLASLARGRLGPVAPRQLEISTIHRFQGREKAVVVFDTVDAPPARSWFLNERRNPDFPRLLNVALSRSREMLVLVGGVDGLRRTLPPNALLHRVIERIRSEGVTLDARRLLEESRKLFPSGAAPAAR